MKRDIPFQVAIAALAAFVLVIAMVLWRVAP